MNPYQKWLGISDSSSAPDYFTLLGVSRDETDVAVIRDAARRQAQKLEQYKNGKHAEACSTILQRIKKAHRVLSNDDLRQEYSRRLAQQKNSDAGQSSRVRKSPAKRSDSASGSERWAGAPRATKRPPAANVSKRQNKTADKSRLSEKPILVAGLAVAGTLALLLAGGGIYYWISSPGERQPTTNLVSNSQSNESPASEELKDEPVRQSEVAAVVEAPPAPQGEPSQPPSETPAMDADPSVAAATVDDSSKESSMVVAAKPDAIQIVQQEAIDPPTSPAVENGSGDFTGSVSGSDPKDETNVSHELASENDQLVSQAHAVLKQHCIRCHGEQESDEGGFDFASDRDKLIAAGYVLPGDAKESPLLERMISQESPMPPAGEEPRPTEAEVALVRDWIEAGALPFAPVTKQPFVSTHELFQHVASDLNQIKKKDRSYVRYFSIAHLGNAGYSPKELQIYKTALAKLLNSLSWNRSLAALNSIDGCQTVFRIDLRDLKWTSHNWQQILDDYPYGVEFESLESQQVYVATECKVPIVRADWFVAAASRPPLYHDLLQIPETDLALEALLQVDVAGNIEQERVVRAAFTRSGVSQHNRMIERHESIFGAYWKSYDFGGSTGRKNLFENPLGPGEDRDLFEHDGGEIIFRLPNGMLGYMLVDAFGRRIDKGPTEIVSDMRQADRAVVNGVSCMSCHYGGMIQKSDEIRRHVQANKAAYSRYDDIMALYPDSAKTSELVEADTRDYLAALANKAIGINKPTRSGEPIVLVSNRYANEVDINLAAAELGIQTEAFRNYLDRLANRELSRTIGTLKISGGVVKRETFSSLFLSVVREFKLGKVTSNVAKRNTGRQPANRRTVSISPRMPFGNRPAAAEAAFEEGVKAFEKRDWKTALAKFEDAIRLAPDANFRLRAYERAIPLYEQNKSTEKLVQAHQAILDVASDPASIKTAHDRFFHSIIRLVNQTNHTSSWRRWANRDEGSIRWSSVEIPASVASVIVNAFQSRLDQTPDHEPSLRILQTFYHFVRNDVHKRKEILEKLQAIYQTRKQPMDSTSVLDLAAIYTSTGQAEKGAEIYHEFNRVSKNNRSSSLMVTEARAWLDAGKNDRAVEALEKGEKVVRRNMTSSSASREFTYLAEVYTQIGEADKGIELYKQALKLTQRGTDTKRIQEKLAVAMKLAGGDSAQKPTGADDLLDPKREFRQDAERYEREAISNPSRGADSLLKASRNWLKAGNPDRALATAKKAERALRRTKASSRESSHSALGGLYFELEKTEKSYEHYVEALKLATTERTIEKYQLEISAILEEDPSIKPNDTLQKFLDVGYKYRRQAREKETDKSYGTDSLARNLVDACKLWAKAGDSEELERCGKRAEIVILRMASENAGKSYSSAVRYHTSLATVYVTGGLIERAVDQLVLAIGEARSDDEATRYFQHAQALCEQHDVPVPELDAEVAKKLDPLNRFRVDAAKYEADAKESRSPDSAVRTLVRATEYWLKAKETEQANRTAIEAGKLLLKSDRDYSFSRTCENLAELFEKTDNREQAVRFYKYALASDDSEYQKKKLQKLIDRLSVTDP